MLELVSVIVPVYNAARTIEKTIESILAQSYTSFEIIIVDDCSQDDTFELLKKLQADDQRILLYRNEKNLGVAKTRNFALTKARGTYIAFLDSDDEWQENKLELQLSELEVRKADICYTAYEMMDERKSLTFCQVPPQVTYKELLKENSILCSSVLLRKECLKATAFRSEYFHEDFVLWLELLKAGYQAVGIQRSLVGYKKGGRSANKLLASKNRWVIYRKCEGLSFIQSAYYFLHYTLHGFKKYYIHRESKKVDTGKGIDT